MGPNQGSAIGTSINFPISNISNESCVWKRILFQALFSIASSMNTNYCLVIAILLIWPIQELSFSPASFML